MEKRKTQENVKENAVSRPSSRISRLAQPRKYSATPHTLNKNRSTSTENVSSMNRQMNKRARSATPHMVSETPVRPLIARSLSVLFTPASSNKSVVAKKPGSEQITRILEVVRKHFGPTFLSGGLQTMSAKQFIEILRFFATSICGDRIVIQDNNFDDVKRFIDYLEYPHQMNRSWFKAPTVSIAYDRNVEFLDWLCDFISTDDSDSIANEVESHVAESNICADQEFVARFLGDLKVGFMIWNDRLSGFDEWKSKWICKLITANSHIDDIDASIERVEDEYKSMETKDTSFGKEHLLQAQQKKSNEISEELSKMQAVLDEKRIDLEETLNELSRFTLKRQDLMSTLNQTKMTIKTQKMSADDVLTIIAELEQKQHLVEEKQSFIDSIKSIAHDYEVKIGRLSMLKTSNIFNFNALVQKLFQIGITFDDITIDQLSVHDSDTKDQIKTKSELFVRIREMIIKRRSDIHPSLNDNHLKLTSISNELFQIEDEVGGLKKHLHSLEIQMQKIENETGDAKYNSEHDQQQLQIKIDSLLQKYEQVDSKIKNEKRLAESLKEENKKIFHGIELKSNQLLNAKRERQARREAALSELEKVADQLKDVVKNFK